MDIDGDTSTDNEFILNELFMYTENKPVIRQLIDNPTEQKYKDLNIPISQDPFAPGYIATSADEKGPKH